MSRSFLFITAMILSVLSSVSNANAGDVAVSFTQQPYNYTSVINGTAVFRVEAFMITSPTYTWLEDGLTLASGPGISGLGTATLSLTATASRNGKKYSCTVGGVQQKGTSQYIPSTSSQATLTVVPTAPALALTPPNGSTVMGGSVTTFWTTAQGASWSYTYSKSPNDPPTNIFTERMRNLQAFVLTIPNPISGTLAVTVTAGAASITNVYSLQGVDIPPIAMTDSYVSPQTKVYKGYTLTVPAPGVLGNDIDKNIGKTLTAVLISQPDFGSVVLNANGSFTWTIPATNPSVGVSTSFTYRAFNGTSYSSTPDMPPKPNTTVYLEALPSPGDLNNDGVVDGIDLEIVTGHMGVHYP